jgi:putative peptide zinc metalloprotease protein
MTNEQTSERAALLATPEAKQSPAVEAVLARSLFFAALSPEAHAALAARVQRRDVAAGVAVVREGSPGDEFFLIADGEAEVWTAKGVAPEVAASPEGTAWTPDPQREALVGRLGPGDGFGEMALLLGGRRQATVRAASDLVLYSLASEDFLRVVDEQRGLAASWEEELELRAVATALGRASPFAKLPPQGLRWLAPRLRLLRIAAGADVVREGEPGDALYIVQTGRAAVVRRGADGVEQQIATLGSGDAFGEQALLSGEPRVATVRALEPLDLLRLDRADFEDVLREYRERGDYFVQLALQRQRPRRIEAWELERQEDHLGDPLFILKDSRRHRYLKLSEQGAFLWNLIDGERTVRDLTMAYFARYHVFGLEAVLTAMLQLDAAGFARIQSIDAMRADRRAPSRLRRLHAAVLPWLTHYFAVPDADRAITVLYRSLRPLYLRPILWLLLALALAGAGLFLRYLLFGGAGLNADVHLGRLAIAVSAAYFLQTLLHQLGHALTAKHFGREVHRAGLGWYFLLPVGFVDTSDMWMAGRRRRAAVAFAGPFVDFLVAAILVLLIPWLGSANLRTLCFQFALTGFGVGLLSLNPLQEWDGYDVLMDWLEVPNLRRKALAFIGSRLRRTGSSLRDRRLARIFTAYGILTLLYSVIVTVAALLSYHAYVQEAVGRVLPPLAAGLLGWSIAGLFNGLILASVWEDLGFGASADRSR